MEKLLKFEKLFSAFGTITMALVVFLATTIWLCYTSPDICYVVARNIDNMLQVDAMRTRAIVFMHRVTENAENGRKLLQWIQRDFPWIRTYALTSFQDAKSLVPLETDTEALQIEIYQWFSLQPNEISVCVASTLSLN